MNAGVQSIQAERLQEIDFPLELTEAQIYLVERHGLLNLLNVMGLAQQIVAEVGTKEDHEILSQHRYWATQLIQEGFPETFTSDLEQAHRRAIETIQRIKAFATEEALGAVEIFQSVAFSLEARLKEFYERKNATQEWYWVSRRKVREVIGEFLSSMEKVSQGRYRLRVNVPPELPTDYRLVLGLESSLGAYFLPRVWVEVIRDLLANARKYTAPGGEIQLHLIQENHGVMLEVSDTGSGIPPDELHRVFEFGYRASNVQGIRTYGGGFGLTKAYYYTKRWGGRLWVSSVLNQGTQIRIHLPIPTT